jgi:acetyl/propionyl-CoA carboxylase alpha subunit
MKRVFRLVRPGGEEATIAVDLRGDVARAEIDGRAVSLELVPKADGTFVALFEGGRVLRARIAGGRKETRVRTRGRETALALFDPRDEASVASGPAGTAEVLAAMPGRVLEVRVRAETPQVVAAVACVPGQAVDAGALLIRFEADRL